MISIYSSPDHLKKTTFFSQPLSRQNFPSFQHLIGKTETADRRPLFLALLVLTARIIYLPHKVFNVFVNKHIAQDVWFLLQFFTDKCRLILSLDTRNDNKIQHHVIYHLISPAVLISFLSWSAATFLSVCIMQFITKHTTSSTVCILKPSESFCSVCGFVLYMGFLIKRACLRVR